MKMKKNQGSILIDVLLALGVSLALSGIFANLLQLFSHLKPDSESLQNRLGLAQLQYYLLLAYDFQPDGDQLRYLINEEEYILRLSNNRLIQQPGTLIFMLGIQQCEFYWEDETIMMSYLYQETDYEQALN